MTQDYDLVKVDAYTVVAVPKKPAPPQDEPQAKQGVKRDGDQPKKPVR